ncbi:Putative membrane protein [Corynebacterium glyciniphilum AJ 3170]|uniref:Putative membrane protein n=1 Tax=Corynebacterium glyciniphilum AJ 3170 TaxID=1404245 RepID=X5DML4_9CORY|nr:hypothetical protein [Corynebacterium glyciniphilum]AHW62544.1 Putative membrane protein [Corynebacterium glyciniphilum AJ 3170]
MSTTTRPTDSAADAAPATASLPVTASSPESGQTAENATDNPTTQPTWIPVVKLIIGVLVVLAALTFSEHIAEPISDYGYVPVMFCYVIVMMIGGGLMVSGFLALWRKATSTSTPQQ